MLNMKQLEQFSVNELNARLKDEYMAFFFYRAASNWCENQGFSIAAKFFAEESDTENGHAKVIQDYLNGWNVIPALPSVSIPQSEFGGLKDIITQAYGIEYALYEKYERSSINIFEANDVCTFDFLQQFRKIQTDSVREYSDMLNKLDGVEDTKLNLLLLEKKIF